MTTTYYEQILQLKPSGGTTNTLFILSPAGVWRFNSMLPFYNIPTDTQLIWFFDDVNADDGSEDPTFHNVVVQGHADIMARTSVKHSFVSFGVYHVKAFLKLPDKYIRADKKTVLAAPHNFTVEPASGTFISNTTIRMGCTDPAAKIFYTVDGTLPYDVKDRGDWSPSPVSGDYVFNDLVTAPDGYSYRYTSLDSISNPEPGAGSGWEDFWERNGSVRYSLPFGLDRTCSVTAAAFSKQLSDIEEVTREYGFNIIPGVAWNHRTNVIYHTVVYLVPSLVDVTPEVASMFEIVYTVTGGTPDTVFDPAEPIVAESTTTVKYFVRDVYGHSQGPTLTATFRVRL